MSEENEKEVISTPKTESKSPISGIQHSSPRPLPALGVRIGVIVASICAFVLSLVILLYRVNILNIIDDLRFTIIWWLAWGFLVVYVVLTFIITSKKYRPSKLTIVSIVFGMASAIILLISAFLYQ